MPQPAPQPRTRQEFHRCIRAAATPLTSLLFSCTLRLHCVTPGRACRHFRRSRHHAAPVGRGTVQNFSCADCPWRSPTRFSLLRPWSRSQAVAHSARTTRGGGDLGGVRQRCTWSAPRRRRDRGHPAGSCCMFALHTPTRSRPLRARSSAKRPGGTHHFLSGEGSA
jgi:hypothetical protein